MKLKINNASGIFRRGACLATQLRHLVGCRLSTTLLILFLLLTFSCKTNKELTKQGSSEFLQEHAQFKSKFEDQLISLYKEKSLFGDVIFAIVDEDGLVYSFALNREILEGKKSSLDNNSPLYIASSTKSFTGTLLKILEENQKLDLNKSLYKYLPQLTYSASVDTRKITVNSCTKLGRARRPKRARRRLKAAGSVGR